DDVYLHWLATGRPGTTRKPARHPGTQRVYNCRDRRGGEIHGTLDIRRNSNVASPVEIYQVRYEDPTGNSFVASMNKDELRELLYRKLALDLSEEELDSEYARLVREGYMIFPAIKVNHR